MYLLTYKIYVLFTTLYGVHIYDLLFIVYFYCILYYNYILYTT